MPAGWAALAILAGVALGYGGATGATVLPGGAALLIAPVVVGFAVALVTRRPVPAVATCLLLGAGIARGLGGAPTLTAGDAGFYAGRLVTLSGTIDAEPDVRDSGTFLLLAVATIAPPRMAARPVHGLVAVRYAGTPPVDYGDVLQLTGRLESTVSPPGAGYKAYLRAKGVGAIMTYPRMLRLAHNAGNPLQGAILRLRATLEETIQAMLPQPYAGVLAALLMGGPGTSLGSLAPSFVDAGMIHVVATSGLKVAIVVGLVYRLAVGVLGWRWAFLPTVPATIAYVALTGATPAGVRAGLMWGMVLLAQRWGRRSHALTSLALTAAAMALLTPSLIIDVGFQMSVLGTAGVAGLADPLEERLRRLPEVLREGLAVTFAAQAATVPVVAGAFGQVSVIGPLANALCLPVMAMAMALGAAGAAAALAFPALAHAAGWPAYAVVWSMVTLVQWFGAVPAASLHTSSFSLAAAGGYDLALLLGVWWVLPAVPRPGFVARFLPGRAPQPGHHRTALPPPLVLAVGAGSLVLAVGWQAPPGTLYRLTFLGVGHGTAVVLQTPRNQVVVIDGGDGAHDLRQALGKALPFWRRTLTLVLVTATDRAHVGGLLGLTHSYHVGEAADAGSFYPSASYALWRAELRAGGVHHLRVRRGQRLVLDPSSAIDVLAPDNPDPASPSPPVAYRLWIGRVSLLLVNSPGMSLAPETWQATLSPTGQAAGRDTVVDVPMLPQRGNATWRLLVAARPALAILPSAADATALSMRTSSLATPPETAQTWQGGPDSRLDLLTDGRGYAVRALP